MDHWLIISAVSLFTIGELALVCGVFRNSKALGIIGGIIILFFVVMSLFHKPIPTAMDVYQGKTDIEYIYKDGRKVDSVVVFKNIYYCN
jgi:hypothetical protein